ncbi:IS1634 family transposase ISMac12 [subsurface metagenome]
MTMTHIIEQKVGKYTYIYEATSYWDRQKKQPRKNRIYLGKKDPSTGKIVSTRKAYNSLDYGNTYFLDAISKKIGLQKLPRKYFKDTWVQILTLIFYCISEAKPLYLAKLWQESTYCNTDSDLSSQRTSELLKRLGKDEEGRLKFLKAWAKMHKNSSFLVFDITSFSSYSKKLELLEWGYNRDREKLPQVNFGLIYGEPSSLPLFYSVYPGSISDVSTLKNMISFLDWLELKSSLFILDKGFYSLYNLNKLNTDMHFLIPVPYSTKVAIKLIREHSDIDSHNNAFLLNGNILHCVADKIAVGEKSYYAYIYLNERKRTEGRDIFLKKILEIEKKVDETDFKTKKDMDSFLNDNVKGWKSIFKICRHPGGFKLKRDSQEINDKLERMGTTILASNRQFKSKSVISLYRRKDRVEKFFDSMKNDLDRKRLRTHSNKTFEGRLFLDFLALVVYSQISKVAREEQIFKDYTIQELMYEFKKIKLIHLREKKTIITEVSKKQRELFKKFKINLLP